MPSKQDAPPIPYRAQWLLAILVGMAGFVVTGLSAGATDLGLSRADVVLLGIAGGCLTMVASILPRVFAVPTPERTGKD